MSSHPSTHAMQVGQRLRTDRPGACPDGSVVLDSLNRAWQVDFGDRWSEAGGEQEYTLAELHRVAGELVIAYVPAAKAGAHGFGAVQ